MRSRNCVMGGNRRRPSLMHAWRYGRRRASWSRMGEEICSRDSASSISATSRAYTLGLEMMASNVALIEVAVVSDPATLFAVR